MSDQNGIEVIVIKVPTCRLEFPDGRVAVVPLLDALHDLAERWEPTAARQREATAGREATADEAGRSWNEYVAMVQGYFSEKYQLALTYGEALQLDRELQRLATRHHQAEISLTRDMLAAAAPVTATTS